MEIEKIQKKIEEAEDLYARIMVKIDELIEGDLENRSDHSVVKERIDKLIRGMGRISDYEKRLNDKLMDYLNNLEAELRL